MNAMNYSRSSCSRKRYNANKLYARAKRARARESQIFGVMKLLRISRGIARGRFSYLHSFRGVRDRRHFRVNYRRTIIRGRSTLARAALFLQRDFHLILTHAE